MKLYLVRHGESKENVDKFHYEDADLSQVGEEQIKKVAERLKDHKFDRIYTSNMIRAIKTAKEIQKNHNNQIVIDKRLRERDAGILVGKPHSAHEMYSKGEGRDRKAEGGESKNDQIERVGEFLKELGSSHENILIVSHGGTMRSVLVNIMGEDAPFLQSENYFIPNTSLYEIDVNDEDAKIIIEACDKHLTQE